MAVANLFICDSDWVSIFKPLVFTGRINHRHLYLPDHLVEFQPSAKLSP